MYVDAEAEDCLRCWVGPCAVAFGGDVWEGG